MAKASKSAARIQWSFFCWLTLSAMVALVCWTSAAPVRASGEVIATQAKVAVKGSETAFSIRLSAGVTAEVFTLSDPYRVIIDMPDVSFRLTDQAGQTSRGLIRQFRYGMFAAGKARIVIDTQGPVLIRAAEMARVGRAGAIDLTVRVASTDAKSFGVGTGPRQSAAAQDADDDDLQALKSADVRNTKPVIVIDPGHGGVDPGAIGAHKFYEKNIVLAVGQDLARRLRQKGRFEVHLTRPDDVFVSLDDRVRASRRLKADLFISLHADSLGDRSAAHSIRGATVYTLSSKASDEQARLMAEKENRSDLIAGLAPVATEHKDNVANILIDLLKRETADFSTDFSNVLVSKLGPSVKLSRKPQRSAAFKVLKQTRTPAVLIELGYLSNPHDLKMMRSKRWRAKMVYAISEAVTSYFSRRMARAN